MKKSTKEKDINDPVPQAPHPAGQSTQQQVVPLLYADAIGNLLMSPINSRVSLVLNAGQAKDGVQPTVPAMELVIPTPALLAFAKQLLKLVRDRGPEFVKAYEAAAKQAADFAVQVDK